MFFLAMVVDVPAPPPGEEPKEWLGVDLGIVNLATDSTGKTHCGKGVRAIRRRNARLRARLQAKGTKSAKPLLKRRRRKESRLVRDVNHVISKQLVGKAKDTRAGIALEDLQGIRERVTVRKAQRADLHSWGFHQLRTFVTYKAALAGVPVRLVAPRNTSRTRPGCGHLDRRNRPIFAFAGYARIATLGEEVRDPARTIDHRQMTGRKGAASPAAGVGAGRAAGGSLSGRRSRRRRRWPGR
ncbi:RNA-guided endonuclease TnpB family protein [Streptosporangium sp. NPDC001681]|uniref:RNA-guided endonuclease TnpB family protein n=1 Tax=Streptosporangium sp. NPDC001681 TaxID=3154395 RepID=UPI00332FB4F0